MARARGWQAVAWTAIASAAAGCGLSAPAGERVTGGASAGTRPPQSAQLTAYTSCGQMLEELRTRAFAVVGPAGLAETGAPMRGAALGAPGALAAPSTAGVSGSAAQGAAGSGASTPAFSPTNDQEQGVDEPDLAKTDGRLLVTLRRQGDDLEVARVPGDPTLVGSLAVGEQFSPTGIFLIGNDAVVLGDTYASAPSTEVVVVDLTTPEHPAVARSFTVQGRELDARLVAGRVELVVQSSPRLPFVAPSDPTPGAAAQALSANRGVIARSTPADWLPTVTSEPSGTVTTAPCTGAMQAASSQGLDTVSVVPIDPSADNPGPAVTVVGDGSTVYASTTTLYVAAPVWPTPSVPVDGPAPLPSENVAPATPPQTDVYGFDLSDPGSPRYVGAGRVQGTLIGPYALSAYQGYLRVATTVGDATPPPNEGTAPVVASDNRVTVLQAQGGALVPVSQLTGLGAGEKIYAVRFMGPLGYVVTFRQTDPLFVLDLSNPRHPTLSGQLALDGYSSFLEPLSAGLLLGVGQSVDANLRVQGLQVSLFDVSDPADPKLLGKEVLANADSLAQSDPHALLYWAPTGTVVVPVQQYGQYGDSAGAPAPPFDGAVAFGVNGTLREVGRISQPAVQNPEPVPMPACQSCAVSMPAMVAAAGIERAIVVGSMLYTVSETGIMASDLATYATRAWLPYPA